MFESVSMEVIVNAFDAWLDHQDCSAHTRRAYRSDVQQFAAWFTEHTGESFNAAVVTDFDVRDWRDRLITTHKPASVNRKLAALGRFFAWAIAAGQATVDPTVHINGIEEQPTAPKALLAQDVTRILRQARKANSRDAALLEVLAATGLRVSEVAALTLGDLELGERSGWVTVRSGKGRKQRRVPLHVRARQQVVQYLQTRGISFNEVTLATQSNSPLFLSQKGAAMTSYAVWYTVKKYAALAGVEHVTPHSFRHTVATRLVRNPDVDLVTAATFLGHSRLDTTARYARPSADDLARAATQLE